MHVPPLSSRSCAMRLPHLAYTAPMPTRLLPILLLSLFLAACGTAPLTPYPPAEVTLTPRPASAKGNELALYALGLLNTGYRFSGKNPEAGLDCSGMVSYIFAQALGMRLTGSAADMAQQGQAVARQQLRPGDLVFFNTRNRPFSHVGVYLGDERFIHAPSSRGRVRIDRLSDAYYASRYETARSYVD